MSTPIILIDGYNLLFRHEETALNSKGRLGDFRFDLLKRLNKYRIKTGKYRIWVVFDSGKRLRIIERSRARSVQIMYTSRKIDADSYIVYLCQRNSGKVYLVTSDNEVRNRASQDVRRLIHSQEFLDNYLYPMVDIVEKIPELKDGLVSSI